MSRNLKSIWSLDAVGLVLVGCILYFFLCQMLALPLVWMSYFTIAMLFSLWSVFADMRSKSKATDTFVLFQLVYRLVVDALLG